MTSGRGLHQRNGLAARMAPTGSAGDGIPPIGLRRPGMTWKRVVADDTERSAACPVVICRPSTDPMTRKKWRARPAHDCHSQFLDALVSHRPDDGGERLRGNRKGTNPGPPERTGRTRRTAIVLRTPPRVLSSTEANCGPPFGTKRPQVQILSPRLYSRRSEALTRVGEGLSCCQYRSKIRLL
jgi:hypothetical protein